MTAAMVVVLGRVEGEASESLVQYRWGGFEVLQFRCSWMGGRVYYTEDQLVDDDVVP